MIKNLLISILVVFTTISCYYWVINYSRAKKAEKELYENMLTFNKADSIVSEKLNKNNELVTTTLPTIFDDSKNTSDLVTLEVRKLLDSVADIINPPKKHKPIKYSSTDFKLSVEDKAEVKDSVAYLIKDNWNLSYNYRDSIFKGEYYGRFNEYTYQVPKKFLGLSYGKGDILSSKWFSDSGKGTSITSPITVYRGNIKNNKVTVSSKTNYRFLDNSLSTGAEVYYNLGFFDVGTNVSYNITNKKPETELSIKFGIVN